MKKIIWQRRTVSHWLKGVCVCVLMAVYTGDRDLLYEGPIHQSSPLDSTGHVQEPNMIQPNLSDFMDALQAQQALLQKVLKQQESMEKKQNELEVAVNTLADEVQLVREADTPNEKQQRKSKVPRDLTVSHY